MEKKSLITGIAIGVGSMILMAASSRDVRGVSYEAVVRGNDIFIMDTSTGAIKKATNEGIKYKDLYLRNQKLGK